jgi:myo-inositol 2-dehydrogenase/D-chiro-inositol 1-dehydrogenase
LAVFTEKPVDETAEKIESIFRYSEAVGIELCCGFQRRFDPSYVAATDAVMRGEIGKPVSASIFCADHPCPPKKFLLTGGNIFMDLSAHDVDYIIHTLQDEVVYATGTSSDDDLAAVGVHDNATMIMNFHQGKSLFSWFELRDSLVREGSVDSFIGLFVLAGAVVTLFLSRFATYGYDQRCEIFGSDGLVSVKNVHSNTAVVSNKDGIHQSRLQHSFPQRFNEAFALELNAFADTVLLDKPWPVTADQCVRVQRVADAARLSADCGQVVAVEPYKRRPVVNAVPSLWEMRRAFSSWKNAVVYKRGRIDCTLHLSAAASSEREFEKGTR